MKDNVPQQFSILLLVVAILAGCQPHEAGSPTVSGTIETDEARLASRYGGRVEKVLAREGEQLQPGQIIVQLEAAELRARRDQAGALLAEWEAGPRAEELAGAKSDWESLNAELEFARMDALRARELFDQKATSAADRDRAVSRAQALEKSVAAAKARHDLLIAGTRSEKLAQVRAQLAEIEIQLREMTITAPTNCVLEVLNVKVGDVLAPNRELATVLLPHLWVRVFVPEPWLGHIKINEEARVKVDSFPNETFTGTVEQISRVAEFTPRNVQTVDERVKQVFGVKIRLPANDEKLRAGMSADVHFPRVPQRAD